MFNSVQTIVLAFQRGVKPAVYEQSHVSFVDAPADGDTTKGLNNKETTPSE